MSVLAMMRSSKYIFKGMVGYCNVAKEKNYLKTLVFCHVVLDLVSSMCNMCAGCACTFACAVLGHFNVDAGLLEKIKFEFI